MATQKTKSETCNLLNCYKSLLRVRGDADLERQIVGLEKEWLQLIDEADEFVRDVRQMEKDKKLLLGIRCNRNFKKGKLMGHYLEKKMYIPYLCFWKKGNIFQWEAVSEILKSKNATFDETVLHMWIYRGMRDYYWRASKIADHIEQLLNYQHECAAALEIEQLDRRMLPAQMLRAENEISLPGY